jgi:hypothetical protein
MANEHEPNKSPDPTVEPVEDEQLLLELAVRWTERKDPVDPRYERLALGDADAREELEAGAAFSEDARAQLELYRPIDDVAKKRIAAALDESAGRDLDRPQPMRWRRAQWMRRVLPLAAVASVALIFGLVVLRKPRPEALPTYMLQIVGGQSALRSPGMVSDVVSLRPGGALELIVRPETPYPESPALEAYLERAGKRTPLRGAWTFSANGAAKLVAEVDPLFAEDPSEGELVVVIGRDGEDGRQTLRARVKRTEVP